ncbi:unnamed protein product [Rhizoctonia solani]|uniref:Uncharacterized protein n=1 Tax=Rhizoctonia solani TaxID=456999 RepID=A0A8H3B4J4_9AGAM|nr:unnamed protein product [Rhizoctonia solani]
MDHQDWGPAFSEYAAVFHERMEASFARYLAAEEAIIDVPGNIIPLDLLETALATGENMHKIGYRGGPNFPVLFTTMQEYTRKHSGDAFENYFGFLCIRNLIRMVCIGILSENSSLEGFLKKLNPDMSRNEVTELLSSMALNVVHQAMATNSSDTITDLLGFQSFGGAAFVDNGGLRQEDARFLVHLLWKSRKSIILLKSKQLLPGLPTLLFVLSEMTKRLTDIRDSQKVQLQDLTIRSYLVNASDPDREILSRIAMWIHNSLHPPGRPGSNVRPDYVPVDDDDGTIVAQAYINLSTPPIDQTLGASTDMFIGISMVLFRWIFTVLTKPEPRRPSLDELIPVTMNIALERLRVEIDRESSGPMTETMRTLTWYYSADICRQIRWFHENTRTPNVREALVTMLYNAEFHDLLGRYLTIVFRSHDIKPQMWEFFLGGIEQISDFLKLSPRISATEMESAAAQWLKITNHVFSHFSSLAPCPTPKAILSDAMDAWSDAKTCTGR